MSISLVNLRYIVALDVHRNFVKAAEACSVTQPTLSTAVRNLENELDVIIFDRSSYPITPTLLGERIISLARATLRCSEQIEEFIASTRGMESGELSLGIIPTVSPYILPEFFRRMGSEHPGIMLKVTEMRTNVAIEKLLNAEIDAAIMATPLENPRLMEIPLYYENFIAYISPMDELSRMREIPVETLATDRMWVLEEGHCLRTQVMNFCHFRDNAQRKYQAGSIATLVDIVDKNGGYTVIPQLHTDFLSKEQRANLREIIGNSNKTQQESNIHGDCPKCVPNREISIVIREDFIRERMLNVIADIIKTIIPENMIDERLKRYNIKM